ncbi:F0F1 ATP synthase subunit gamma [Roseinatronobacter sp.]|uniref:F0F1 ATP synthase subunit gamma n=1 Tax=Roseinatronobacter sp. TaxID=1945755 RepID=UPI0025E45387|nr:F0F1 ATP synthase subunit gamma [Roseibaca sp.]
MQTLESLSDALETAEDIHAIVRTMKALSAASIRQFEQAEEALGDYARTVDLGLTALMQDRHARGLPLPRTGAEGSSRTALIVIGSERGLCGRYNETVANHALEQIDGRDTLLAVIGLRAAARLEAAGHQVDTLFTPPGTAAGLYDLVQSVIVQSDKWQRENGIGRIRVVHNRREGRTLSKSVDRQLLPLPDAYLESLLNAPWPGPGLPFFRMSPPALLSWLVQQRLFVVLYRALAEALASEHATRLAAMQGAERNIEERREGLMQDYRVKRQETITRELMDVVSGFEAVSTAQD